MLLVCVRIVFSDTMSWLAISGPSRSVASSRSTSISRSLSGSSKPSPDGGGTDRRATGECGARGGRVAAGSPATAWYTRRVGSLCCLTDLTRRLMGRLAAHREARAVSRDVAHRPLLAVWLCLAEHLVGQVRDVAVAKQQVAQPFHPLVALGPAEVGVGDFAGSVAQV